MAKTQKQRKPTTKRNMQDSYLSLNQSLRRDLEALEGEMKKFKEVFGLAMTWISERDVDAPPAPLSAENVAQLIEKLK